MFPPPKPLPQAPFKPFSYRDLINTPACRDGAGTETLISGRGAQKEHDRERLRDGEGACTILLLLLQIKSLDKTGKLLSLSKPLVLSQHSFGCVVVHTRFSVKKIGQKCKMFQADIVKIFFNCSGNRVREKKKERERE